MNLGGIELELFLASLMVASVPILLAAIGELVVEKAGVLNLGVEGMMIAGAVVGFATAVGTGSPFLGFLGGAAGAMALSLIFAFLTQVLLANQVATGLALTLFGLGLSALIGQGYVGLKPPLTGDVPFGPLEDIPFFGTVLFGHDPMVYVSILVVAAVWVVLTRSRTGLILRAVGESHDAAHALGYKVIRIRVLAILFGGAMAGLGGVYVSLIRVPQWTDGITSGAGWIALAIVVFASWRPWRVLLGAWLFGGISVLQLSSQVSGGLPVGFIALVGVVAVATTAVLSAMRAARGQGAMPSAIAAGFCIGPLVLYAGLVAGGVEKIGLSVELLSMSPYLITILVLVIMSSGKGRASLSAPAALGTNFHASR